MKQAREISEMEIQGMLRELDMPENWYWQYFLKSDSDQKMMYLKRVDRFSEDRKAFLKDPSQMVFSRQERAISMLDSIENDAIKRMAISLDIRQLENLRNSNCKSKLWKSDVFFAANQIGKEN